MGGNFTPPPPLTSKRTPQKPTQIIFKHQSHKVVKHPETIRRQETTNCLSVFHHFVGLAVKTRFLVSRFQRAKFCT